MKPDSEPVAIGALVVTLIQAILVALTVLKVWVLDGTEQAAMMGVVTATVALATAVIVRSKVTPMSKIAAKAQGPETVAGPAAGAGIEEGTPVELTPIDNQMELDLNLHHIEDDGKSV